MILPVATVLSVILYTSFALTAFADDIAPRAGIGGAVGGGGGSGGRGGGAGGGSGTKSSKGKPKDHEHNGGSSNSKGTKLTKLDKFPAPESLMISDDDAASVFSLGSFKEQDDQVLFESRSLYAYISRLSNVLKRRQILMGILYRFSLRCTTSSQQRRPTLKR